MKDKIAKPTMQLVHLYEDDDDVPDEPVVDLTQSLPLHSKRTERKKKREEQKKSKATPKKGSRLLDLPYEILSAVLCLLHPRDIVALMRTSRSLHTFLRSDEAHIAQSIISVRYASLTQCFRLPALLSDVAPEKHAALRANVPTRAFQHVRTPNPDLVCTCMTCLNRWNCLCLVVDFHHWQGYLDENKPLPTLERGRNPTWNQELLEAHARRVEEALTRPLAYVALLEMHLESTTRAIRRHAANKFNHRRRFRMTDEDVRAGTDLFLDRSGPPTVDFPYHRDNYYLLEAYLPNRSWIRYRNKWFYMSPDQHNTDVEIAVSWAKWRAQQAEEERARQEAALAAEATTAEHVATESAGGMPNEALEVQP